MEPLSEKETAIYTLLRDLCKCGHATPTIDRISDRSGVRRGSIQGLLARLRAAGLLRIEGRAHSVRYGIELPNGWRYTKPRSLNFSAPRPREFGGGPIATMPPAEREHAIAKLYREKDARYDAEYPDRIEPVRVALG